jgi:hypothetical protein
MLMNGQDLRPNTPETGHKRLQTHPFADAIAVWLSSRVKANLNHLSRKQRQIDWLESKRGQDLVTHCDLRGTEGQQLSTGAGRCVGVEKLISRVGNRRGE